jgi:hypothetical protein
MKTLAVFLNFIVDMFALSTILQEAPYPGIRARFAPEPLSPLE